MTHRLARFLRGVSLLAACVAILAGCASSRQSQLQETIRKAAGVPVGEAPGSVAAVFSDLARAAGLDPSTVYVAIQTSYEVNASAAGNHHFYVTRGLVEFDDRCFLVGVAAHELAHGLLKHPEQAARTSDAVSIAGTILGTAAGMFVPGAGYLVQGATTLGLRAYSRSQEEEADHRAVMILRSAGEPEWLLRYALERLQQHSGSGGGGWLSTHPAIADRIAAQPQMDLEEVRRVCGSAPTD